MTRTRLDFPLAWKWCRQRAASHVFELIITILLIGYFALDLTPSAYAYVLRTIGVTQTGLLLGEPSPLRSDEFIVWTPYLQAAVRNGFHRYNETSVYGEDMRNFNALPLWDWALAFKPQFWGFFALPPDRAFSLYHTLLIGSFLIGWSAVFRNWAFPPSWAAAASLLYFFSGANQFSWTTSGPLVAVFPLLLLAYCSEVRSSFKFLLLTWLIAVWLFSHFYPPVFISLALTAPFLIGAFRPGTLNWRNIGVGALAFLAACLLVRLYFDTVFGVMAATVFPGSRSFPGGLLAWQQGLANFFPFVTTRMEESLIGANAFEVTTASSYLPLVALIFLDWRNLLDKLISRDPADAPPRRAIYLLLAGLALLAAWSFLPIPSDVGALLLLDKVQPQRMVYASGILLIALALLLLKTGGARWSLARFLLLTSVVVCVWILTKGGPSLSPQVAFSHFGYWDITIIPAVGLAGLWVWSRKGSPVPALLVACVAVNIAGFGWINPLQSAKPIFANIDTPVMDGFRDLQQRDPRHWLVASGMPGATLNGLGFRSVNHVLIAPQLAFFRPYFPELGDAKFNNIFNRYARIELAPVNEPYVAANDLIFVPIAPFLSPAEAAEMTPEVSWQHTPPASSEPGGYVDELRTIGNQVVVSGWAMLDPKDRGNRLIIVSDQPRRVIISAAPTFRPDVANALGDGKLLYSGIELKLSGEPNEDTFQIFSESLRYGMRQLHMPSCGEASGGKSSRPQNQTSC